MSWFTRTIVSDRTSPVDKLDEEIKKLNDLWSERVYSFGPKPVPVVHKDPIENATDDALIFELIKRGYAVGRLNENNQLDAATK